MISLKVTTLVWFLHLGVLATPGRDKRADVDLQTCINNFAVHRDKIIRTQDSQNMGAKYLNEIDLGTREECLRLCCETDDCDVFVFEEKSSGSCYLFHCGPPEDFKCKFTHHVNYSSAVLAINRHLPDLESQIKLTKHEQDLSKLRKPGSGPELVSQPSSTTTTTTTPKPKELLPFIANPKTLKPPEPVRKCSRNQFECRSTNECIAIYNACDGIPQCADGSDEAPELACPESATTAPPAPSPVRPKPSPPARYDMPPPRIHPLTQVIPQPDMYREGLLPPHQPENSDFLRPNGMNNLNPRMGNYETAPQYIPANMQGGHWMPHPQNQLPPYQDKNSRIFTHKENGLQVPDGQEISQVPYGADQYNQKMSYYDGYRPENWPGNPPEEPQFPGGYPQEVPKTWQVPEAPKETPVDHPFGLNKEAPKHEQDKMAHELKHSKVTEEAKIKIEKPAHAHYSDVMAYKMEGIADLPDGRAETPGGALLSLTLGLIITCILALLIGCRLRVRRRMRKGGKSYAHDADYLVNGMYL